jgi:HAD domain in Swiss Army Knife RNA repair proteins
LAQPLVFLDFDGVLNTPERWGRQPPEAALDPILVKRASRFCDRVDALVVVTSTWRTVHPIEQLRAFLATNGFSRTERAVSVTPEMSGRCRQDEIVAWLETAGGQRPWVVLDDDSLGDGRWERVDGHMVLIDAGVGLTPADVRRAHAILRLRQESATR